MFLPGIPNTLPLQLEGVLKLGRVGACAGSPEWFRNQTKENKTLMPVS
jgi:hypothetical protein